MKITFKQCQIATAILVALSLSACSRFETRMQANGSYQYKGVELTDSYESGDFTRDEARDQFDIPTLTEQQKQAGFTGIDVDVRPPTQLMALIDGVLLAPDPQGRTKIWFNSFEYGEQIDARVMQLLEAYLAQKQVAIVEQDASSIQTGIVSEDHIFGNFLSENKVSRESSYQITLQPQPSGQRVAVIVDALSFTEVNEDKPLKVKLTASTKQDIELRFVNDVLQYAYQVKQQEKRDAADNQPLAITLGFDDNHQSTWLADSDFEQVWHQLPDLFTLLNFTLVDHDKNLGYYLLDYSKPSDSYWVENNLQPFELSNGEYFIQLGEVAGGKTSISWLDENKKVLTDNKQTEIYLSIKAHLRDALIEKNKQSQPF